MTGFAVYVFLYIIIYILFIYIHVIYTKYIHYICIILYSIYIYMHIFFPGTTDSTGNIPANAPLPNPWSPTRPAQETPATATTTTPPTAGTTPSANVCSLFYLLIFNHDSFLKYMLSRIIKFHKWFLKLFKN